MKYIKLRIFHNGKMIPCEVTMDDYVHIYNEETLEFEIVGCLGKGRIPKEVHVMQFTGMFDKKEDLIYEGDIVKLNTGDDGYVQGKIVFHNAAFVLKTDMSNIVHPTDSNFLLNSSEDLEIVGNIYE